MAKRTPIQKAVATFDDPKLFAAAVGVSPAFVWQWVNGKRPVPAQHCIPIEKATGGAVTRYDLRPDVFGSAPTSAAA